MEFAYFALAIHRKISAASSSSNSRRNRKQKARGCFIQAYLTAGLWYSVNSPQSRKPHENSRLVVIGPEGPQKKKSLFSAFLGLVLFFSSTAVQLALSQQQPRFFFQISSHIERDNFQLFLSVGMIFCCVKKKFSSRGVYFGRGIGWEREKRVTGLSRKPPRGHLLQNNSGLIRPPCASKRILQHPQRTLLTPKRQPAGERAKSRHLDSPKCCFSQAS